MIAMNKLGTLAGNGAAQWVEVAGYITHVKELSVIFGINFITLRNRLAAGWHVAPACMVANTESMSLKQTTAAATTNQFDAAFVNTLRMHFGRPSLAMFPKV